MNEPRLQNSNFSLGGIDANFESVMKFATGKTNFLYPENDSIYVYEKDYDYSGNVLNAGTAKAEVTKSASGSDYTITITGNVSKLDSAAKTALFGSGAQTNACVLLVEVPADYKSLTFKSGNSEVALSESDTIVIDNRIYFVMVVGMYDSSGTTASATTDFEICYGIHTVKYTLAVENAVLEV